LSKSATATGPTAGNIYNCLLLPRVNQKALHENVVCPHYFFNRL
jgi:hypothetical protein